MKIVSRGRTDTLELRGGGGFLILLGLVFLGVGLGVWALVFGAFPVRQAPPLAFGIPFGLIFAGIGIGMILGRRGCVISEHRQTVTTWWGLLGPWRSTSHALSEYARVSLTKEIRKSDKSTYTVYPIYLAGEPPQEKLKIDESRDYYVARRLGEALSAFCKMPLADISTGTEVVREFDKLNESLRDRLRRTGQVPEMPAMLPSLTELVRRKEREFMVKLPPTGIGPFRSPRRLLISPEKGLSLEIQGKKKKSTRIGIDELEELDLLNASDMKAQIPEQLPAFLRTLVEKNLTSRTGLVARSDQATIQFGGEFTPEQQAFLHQLIQHVLAS
jgi:hypothetical protein